MRSDRDAWTTPRGVRARLPGEDALSGSIAHDGDMTPLDSPQKVTPTAAFRVADEGSDADGVLQLLVVDHGDAVDTWVSAVLDMASRSDGFLAGRSMRSADGGSVVVGLRWSDIDAMSTAAIASTALRRHEGASDGQPTVLVFGPRLRPTAAATERRGADARR